VSKPAHIGETLTTAMPGEGNTEGSCASSPVTTSEQSEVALTGRSPNLRALQNAGVLDREAANIRWYLTGYVDGEGCFCVTFNRSKRHTFGWDIRPSFSVSQNYDRSEVLYLLQETFGCGWIRPDRSDRTLKYEVRSVPELVQKIIPHFERYSLLSGKAKEFDAFAEICRRMLRKEHLAQTGFQGIVELARRLNTLSKKRYLRSEIKV
jgi:LAGLIDADG DNA endonuclease family protein